MKEVTFVFSVDEANTVLDALGQLPFNQVNGLIGKMLVQVREQAEE